MTFASISASTQDATSAYDVPARTTGDLMLLIVDVYDGTADPKTLTLGTLNGVSWTKIGAVTGTGASTEYIVAYYLISNNTAAATTITATPSGDWLDGSYHIMAISGAHQTTPPEGTFNTGLNPGSLDPSGWGSEDTLWISAGANYVTGPTSGPTNYTTIQTSSFMKTSYRQLNASSEDPSTYSGGTGGGSSCTIAIRPAVSTFAPPVMGQRFPNRIWRGRRR